MTEPENHTLHLLREIRGAIEGVDRKLDDKVDQLDKKMERGFERANKRIDSLQQAMIGESASPSA